MNSTYPLRLVEWATGFIVFSQPFPKNGMLKRPKALSGLAETTAENCP
jgi:hypothetical protein